MFKEEKGKMKYAYNNISREATSVIGQIGKCGHKQISLVSPQN
jgi:hypothetical protein